VTGVGRVFRGAVAFYFASLTTTQFSWIEGAAYSIRYVSFSSAPSRQRKPGAFNLSDPFENKRCTLATGGFLPQARSRGSVCNRPGQLAELFVGTRRRLLRHVVHRSVSFHQRPWGYSGVATGAFGGFVRLICTLSLRHREFLLRPSSRHGSSSPPSLARLFSAPGFMPLFFRRSRKLFAYVISHRPIRPSRVCGGGSLVFDCCCSQGASAGDKKEGRTSRWLSDHVRSVCMLVSCLLLFVDHDPSDARAA